jgi:hypothetical protein
LVFPRYDLGDRSNHGQEFGYNHGFENTINSCSKSLNLQDGYAIDKHFPIRVYLLCCIIVVADSQISETVDKVTREYGDELKYNNEKLFEHYLRVGLIFQIIGICFHCPMIVSRG